MDGEEITNAAETKPDVSSPSSVDGFDSAYQGALQGVLYATSQAVEGGEAVALDDSQWAQVRDSLRVVTTCSVLSLLLSSALLGALVWRTFVEGWRR